MPEIPARTGGICALVFCAFLVFKPIAAYGQLPMHMSEVTGVLTSVTEDRVGIKTGDLPLSFRIDEKTKFLLFGGQSIEWRQLHKLHGVMKYNHNRQLNVKAEGRKGSNSGESVIAKLTIGFNGKPNDLDRLVSVMPDILLAAYEGKKDRVWQLVQGGESIDAAGKGGRTPLIAASMFGHEALAFELVAKGAKLDSTDTFGGSAVVYAVQLNHPKIVQRLIRSGASVNIKGYGGSTPLYIAAQQGHTGMVTALIEAQADLNARTDRGSTALFIAALSGHEAAVKALLDAGADTEIPVDDGRKAVDVAKTPAIAGLIEAARATRVK